MAQYRRKADMNFLKTYAKELIALFIPFLTWFLNVGLRAKVKLIWSSPHGFNFLVDEPIRDQEGKVIQAKQTVRTAQVKISNTGRATATKVELVFNYPPQCLNLWPVRHYELKTEPDGRYILIFDSLAPKEDIGLEVLNVNADLPRLLLVRCDQCVAEEVAMMTTCVFRRIPTAIPRQDRQQIRRKADRSRSVATLRR
jgi:hypothetical protein